MSNRIDVHPQVARRAGLLAGAVGYLGAVALLGALFDWSFGKPEAARAAALALLGAGAATWRMGPLAGELIRRTGFRGALWVGPVSGLVALVSGTIAVVLGNLLVIHEGRLAGDDWASLLEAYLARPFVFTLVFGTLPALLIGVLCSVGLWTYLQCVEEG